MAYKDSNHKRLYMKGYRAARRFALKNRPVLIQQTIKSHVRFAEAVLNMVYNKDEAVFEVEPRYHETEPPGV